MPAFDEGMLAHKSNLPRTQNPYDPSTHSATDWNCGWDQMNTWVTAGQLTKRKLSQEAVLAVIKTPDGNFESVTVFRPYIPIPGKAATKYDSFYGLVDISFSWRSTYLMLDRKDSGFYTGTPLAGETFTVMQLDEAIKQAEAIYKANK